MPPVPPPHGHHKSQKPPAEKRQDTSSETVEAVVENDPKKALDGVKIGSETAAKLEGMVDADRKAAHLHAKRLKDPGKEESKFQQGFLKRVNDEAKKRKLLNEKGEGDKTSEEYQDLMQEMFNQEVLEIAEKARKDRHLASRKKANDLAELEDKRRADEARNETRNTWLGAYAGADALEGVAEAAGGFLVGFAKFLNDNCPIKDEWLLLVKMCEALAAVLSLPFKLAKLGIKLAIDENSTPEQIKLFEKLHDPKNSGKLDAINKEIKVANDKCAQDWIKQEDAIKLRNLDVASGGDLLDGAGFKNPSNSRGAVD